MVHKSTCKLWRVIGKSIAYRQGLSVNVINFVYRLLNKNLNFVPAGEVHNKTQTNY